MAAFRCPPERLLRPIAQVITARTTQSLKPAICCTSRRMYRAVVCKELGKPLVVEDFPAVERLKSSQVGYGSLSFMSHFQCQSKNVMIALHECQKWKEQVKVSYHRKFWIFILKIEALVNF
jgi:hypothetical protein